ncbi:uncharacterized protein [Montipora capricornis]|uniref:uncharacterized protein isoform X1 n=1 Tax=Montipora capricornis TaxID=246305 RepID=UPI0035F1AF8B
MTVETVRQKPFGSVMSKILAVAFTIITARPGDAASLCSSYQVSGTNEIWSKAKERCQQTKGYLVAMESEEEWEFLKSKANDSQFQKGVRWHIGLRNVSGKWCWIPSTADSCIEVKVGASRWAPGEPNNHNKEGCVEMLKSGLYNNVPCNRSDQTTGYICEQKIDCNTSDNGKIIYETAPKLSSTARGGGPKATTEPTTKIVTKNPKTQLITTAGSQDVETSKRSLVITDTTSPVLKYITESNQKKKSQWVTIVMIGVPAAILIVLLILLGCIIKRRMVSKKSEGGVPVGNREVEAEDDYGAGQLTNDETHPSESSVPLRRIEGKGLETEFHFSNLEAGYSSKTKDKNTSCTEDNSPGISSWSKEHVYDNMSPENRKHKSASLVPYASGESSKMLCEQGNKTDDQKYLYATVDKTRKNKAKAGVHFKPISVDLVYAELDFDPSSQDALGPAAKETPTRVTATVYASIEETCG